MIVGYFINQYPKVSHSFVRREILALEAQGVEVRRWALRGWDAEIVDLLDASERERTQFLLQKALLPILFCTLATFASAPRRWFYALTLTIKMYRGSDRSALLHIASFLEAARLAWEMRRAKINHLHAHFGTNSAEVAMLGAAISGIPYSFTVHGPDEFDRPLGTKLGLKITKAAFVVAITDFCASQLFRWSKINDWEKIHVVRCGLAADFLSAETDKPPAIPHIVCVGRLSSQKGQLILIAAVAHAHALGCPVTLTLVGDGEMRPEIEGEIRRLGLLDHVAITGWADENEVRTQISNARALILTSFAEGLPVVVMEALALGRPVLATYVAAMADLVIPGQTGWLYTPGASDVVAQAMIDCAMASADTIAAMGQAGKKLVRDRHDANRESAKLAKLFEASVHKHV